MSKKFYVVKNEVNPTTGGFISYKTNYFPSMFQQPFIQPMPITKSPGLSIPLESPLVFSPMSNIFSGYTPQPQVNLTGKPFEPQIIGMSSSIFSPYGTQVVNAYPQVVSPYDYRMPIIKYGSLLQGRPIPIKLIYLGNEISIIVPYNNYRTVIADIYSKAHYNIAPTEPKIRVQIVSPSLNTVIETTYTNLEKIKNAYDEYVSL